MNESVSISSIELLYLQGKSKEARTLALQAIHSVGNGHVGGTMSIMDALVVLYYQVMNIDANNPRMTERDRFVMSKGHAGPAIYTILAMKGFFPVERLQTLNQNGTQLPSHCDMNKVPGIDMTAGSLGQGISAAVGMAIAARLDKQTLNVYCAVGDGECQEGQVWEAALLAAHQKLDRLFVLVDNNKGQVDGYTNDIESVSPLGEKWASFGWNVLTVDGHDHAAILQALDAARKTPGQPHAIILNTVKAKGMIPAEGTPSCHHMVVNSETYSVLMQNLS